MGLCNLTGRCEGLPRPLDLGQRQRAVRFPLVRLWILVPTRKVGSDRLDELRGAREAPRAHAVLRQIGENRSTMFIQELEVGVKCMWKRGCFSNHLTTFLCLCVQ